MKLLNFAYLLIFRFFFVLLHSLFSRLFSLQNFCCVSFDVKQAESCLFLLPKRNFRFNFNYRFRNKNEGAPYWGWSTSTAVLHQVLQHSWSCLPQSSKEVKRHSSGQDTRPVHFSAASRYSPWRCRWHTPHPTLPLPWQQRHPTPTSASHSTNRYKAPGNHWFYSRKLQLAESKYSMFDRELLAAVPTIRHSRHILEG